MFHTHVAQSGDNTLSGGATEVTALAILAELEKQAEFSESIWVDATGTFFIRRVVYSENLETYTVEYTLADGSTYSPTAPIEPASAGTDRELVVTSYTVVTSGTGYTIGDIVQQINVFDVVSDTLQSTIWYNQTTDLTISPAPNIAHLQPEGSIQSIASATGTQADSAYTTGNGTIISLLKGLFGKLATLGQKNMAGSAPVVIASDQSTIPVSTASLPLPSGAATETTLSTVATEIGATNETAPGTDTASSGLNGRLQRIAQRITSLIALWVTPGGAIGTSPVNPIGVSDGSSFVRLRSDSNGRLQLAPVPVIPTSTYTPECDFYVSETLTVNLNSTANGVVSTGGIGGRWLYAVNNSGVICEITIGGTAGNNDGNKFATLIAGAVLSIPVVIQGATFRIKPISGALATTDIISLVVS